MSFLKNYLKLLFMRVPTENCKMVIVVRTDIYMGKGKVGAQCAHAATQCYSLLINKIGGKDILLNWMLQGQPKIVVQIKNERELLELAANAKDAGLTTAVIRDAGRTQLTSGTISVLGIGPGPAEEIDKFTSKLKLL